MKRRSSRGVYARTVARHATVSVLLLTACTLSLAALSIAAARQRNELGRLSAALGEGAALREDAALRTKSGTASLAQLEEALQNERARFYEHDSSAPYRFAAEVKARMLESHVTIVRVLPARRQDPAGVEEHVPAFEYVLSGEPTNVLRFIRSIAAGPRAWNLDRLRLWRDGVLLRAELTIGYQAYEPADL